jgi:hypothetical protein
MKSTKRTIGTLILIAAMAVPATAQETAATSQNAESVSGTFTANSLLKVVTDPGVISLSDNAICYLIQSSHVRGDAIAKVLGSTSEALQTRIRTNVLEVAEIEGPPRERSILLSLDIELEQGAKLAAKELMDALVANFRKAVESAYHSEIRRLDNQAFVLKNEIEYAEKELTEIQRQLMDLSDSDSSPEILRSRITEIRSQLQGLQLEKVSQDAYRRAIVKRIDEMRKEIEEAVHNDKVSFELEEIIQRRTAELQAVRQKVDAGLVPSGDVASVEDRLATARIDLARRREELANTGGAANLAGLTAKLATLTMESEKMQASETQLNQQLEQTRDQLARSGDFERTMLRLEIAKRNLQEAQIAYSRITRQIRTFQMPSISVIGG